MLHHHNHKGKQAFHSSAIYGAWDVCKRDLAVLSQSVRTYHRKRVSRLLSSTYLLRSVSLLLLLLLELQRGGSNLWRPLSMIHRLRFVRLGHKPSVCLDQRLFY